MSIFPTAKDAAIYILRIFVEKFNNRPGEVLRTNNFIMLFNQHPWRSADFADGINYAAEQGWVEILRGGHTFRLMEAGAQRVGNKAMDIEEECKELVTIERADGSRFENVRSLVTGGTALIPRVDIPVALGDAILRQLPSGLVERLIVTDPGFQAESDIAPALYIAKYRLEGQQPAGTQNYVIHNSGPNARFNLNSIDNSTNSVNYISQNMTALADELGRLRTSLAAKADDPDHYIAIGSIASAEKAAKAGDASKVSEYLAAVGSAGKWAFGVAKDIGVAIAAEALKNSVGL